MKVCNNHFVSSTLKDAEINYLSLENLLLALVMTSHKLVHYFQTHPIIVYTNSPLCEVLCRADLSG